MHTREHVISLVLTNEEWTAFVQAQPEPVSWLKERIQERIAAASREPATPVTVTVTAQAVSAA
jgi:hypothetical protein